MNRPKIVVVIPARYGSTRLPGKPLISLAGKPMIQRVCERARLAESADRVIVATDDERIVKAEEKAARLPVLLTVPMVLFILPPLIMVLIGPAVLRVADQFVHRQ